MKKSDLTKLIAIGAAVTAAAATTAIVISKHKKHKTMLAEHTKTLTKKQAYITGGGLSAFASALYLVRDCGFTPENIHIFTNGTRDCGNNETGFICRFPHGTFFFKKAHPMQHIADLGTISPCIHGNGAA